MALQSPEKLLQPASADAVLDSISKEGREAHLSTRRREGHAPDELKNERQTEILNIIENTDVETQDQLLGLLRERGYNATQATISRDIKELRLVKELTGSGKYRYAQTGSRVVSGLDSRLRNIFREGVIRVDAAQNLVVVKTMPGLASAACSALDGMEIDGMVGTLAGDDTGVLIMRDTAAAQRFNIEVHRLLK